MKGKEGKQQEMEVLSAGRNYEDPIGRLKDSAERWYGSKPQG